MAAEHQSDRWKKLITRSLPICLCLVFWVLPAKSALALDPTQPASTYIRTHFGESEGLPGNVVNSIVQSSDGFLWLLVGSGLVRFDGHHFDGFNQPSYVRALGLAPNGDLWVGTNHDLEQIPARALTQFNRLPATSYPLPGDRIEIRCLHFSRRGILWVGTTAGLYRFEAGAFSPVLPQVSIETIEETANGHLLLVGSKGFMELDGAKIVPHPDLLNQLEVGTDGIFHVLQDSHGVTWFCTAKGVARQAGGAALEKLPGYGRPGAHAFRSYQDPNGNVWIDAGKGLFRTTATGLEAAAPDLDVMSVYGDREGDLWAGTNGGGLFRFKDSAARTFTTADGLPNNVVMTVLKAHDGAIWSGFNCGGISRFDGKHFQNYNEKNGLTNSCVWSLAEDAKGDLWIGTFGGGVFRFHDGSFTQYSRAQGLVSDEVRGVAVAPDGSVWFTTAPAVGRIHDGQVRTYAAADGLPPGIRKIYVDRAGGVWVGTLQGLYRLIGDRFVRFSSLPESAFFPVGEDRDGKLYVTPINTYGPGGIFRIENNRPVLLTEEGEPAGMVETDQGGTWFIGVSIFRVPPGGLDRPHVGDNYLDLEMFAQADGLPTGQATEGESDVALSADGKLWIATPKGLVMLDPSRLPWSHRKPAIYVERVTVGRNQQAPPSDLLLPPGTHHLELDFDAIDISSPERTHLQYRMDGVDSEWLDAAGAPGQAIYSTLPPGKHAFHIRATNSSGIWDRAGVLYDVAQQPYFYQTDWFLVASIILGLLVIATLYQLRMRQAVARLHMRLEERVSERTRIARDLHDTLLQSIQGLMFRFQAARNMLPRRPEEAVQALDAAIKRTEQAIAESRDAIMDLRSEHARATDLAELLTATGQELKGSVDGAGTSPAFRVIVEGTRQALAPGIQDEVCRIGRELLRNAFRHARAHRIEAEIRYDDHTLRLLVRDDGKGMDPEVLKRGGRPGHWGVPSARERAKEIGGELDFWSEAGAGTEAQLRVPSAIAYQGAANGRGFRLFRRQKTS